MNIIILLRLTNLNYSIISNSHYQLVNGSCSSSLTIHFIQNKFILRCEVQFTKIKINLQILLREKESQINNYLYRALYCAEFGNLQLLLTLNWKIILR